MPFVLHILMRFTNINNHMGFKELNNVPKACQITRQFVMGFGYRYEVMGHLRVKSINRADSIEKALL